MTRCSNFCKDCRYFGANLPSDSGLPIKQSGESDLCKHPSTISEIDPTNGKPRRYSRNALAYNQRQYPHFFAVLAGRCGARGRFFQPKRSA
jgi:hypothetical protein